MLFEPKMVKTSKFYDNYEQESPTNYSKTHDDLSKLYGMLKLEFWQKIIDFPVL